jgi:hypothetical protein
MYMKKNKEMTIIFILMMVYLLYIALFTNNKSICQSNSSVVIDEKK